MNRMTRVAVLLSIVETLKENGSWCGETHIQKTTYFLQRMLEDDLGLNFILYKHGPYSFDLSEELGCLRADNLLTVVPQHPYGPSMRPGSAWSGLKAACPKTINLYAEKIAFLGKWLGGKGVAELEKLATALYVTKELCIAGMERAVKINELKPHVSVAEAQTALLELDSQMSLSRILMA